MADPIAASLPFDEAIAYLRDKVRLPSRTWTDLREGAHARGFVVAGATTDALVADFHAAMVKAISEGRTLADFRKDFDAIVATHGWTYNGGRNWRTRVIYDTNIRMAHAAGHWAQVQRRAAYERSFGRTLYLRYSAVMDRRTRDQHKAWNGTILPADHPFWATHSPPNGWYCRCRLESLTERDMRRYGYTPSEEAPNVVLEDRGVRLADGSKEIWPTPAGIDTGFGYNPGASWLRGAVPPQLRTPLPVEAHALPAPAGLPPLPAPRPVDGTRILPAGSPAADYAAAFLDEFGATVDRGVSFRDAAGHVVGIDADLFKTRAGDWKADKQGRGRYLRLLADALKDPDEVWLNWATDHTGKPVLRRSYIAGLKLPKLGPDIKGAGLYAVLEWTDAGWTGVTLFQGRTGSYLANQRTGVLLWRRGGRD